MYLLYVEMALGLVMQPEVSLRDALRVVARAGLDEAVHGHRRDMHAVLAEFLRERIGQRTQRRLAQRQGRVLHRRLVCEAAAGEQDRALDRKSTRLNSKSLMRISYADFCLKKKNKPLPQKQLNIVKL